MVGVPVAVAATELHHSKSHALLNLNRVVVDDGVCEEPLAHLSGRLPRRRRIRRIERDLKEARSAQGLGWKPEVCEGVLDGTRFRG